MLRSAIVVAGFLILFLSAARLVLPACGVQTTVFVRYLQRCPPAAVVPVDDLDALADRRLDLERRIAGLEHAIAAPACSVAAPEPALAPVEPAKAEPPEPPPERALVPDVDEAQWDARDLGLLAGCWQLEHVYVVRNQDNGALTNFQDWSICFAADESGEGQQSMRSNNGVTCDSAISGVFDAEGRIVLNESANLPCSDGMEIFRRQITCDRDGSGGLACNSYQPEGGGTADFAMRRIDDE